MGMSWSSSGKWSAGTNDGICKGVDAAPSAEADSGEDAFMGIGDLIMSGKGS